MKNSITKICIEAIIIIFILLCFSFCSSAETAPLHVSGTKLVDESGRTVQLKGVSTHNIAWHPQYVNQAAFQSVKKMGGNTIRLAMYSEGTHCYGSDPGARESLEATIDRGVSAATAEGMYVIIDWHTLHEHDPNVYAAESTDFFSRMSAKYRGNSNVIYEICNEPNGNTTWGDIEDYANKVIPEIRKNDPNALILVGTPKYCQDFTGPMAEPLSYSNIMYTAHFYAGTHKGETRERIQEAIDSGLPIFVSECNICDATGSGNLDLIQAVYWRKFIKDNNLSYIVWNLSNANESAALIKSSCRKTGNWGFFDYSASGKFARIMFRS